MQAALAVNHHAPHKTQGETRKPMKKIALLCVLFAAALASADSINETFGSMPITTQGTWGFNNANPPLALSLNGGNTATLQLGSVVFNAGNVVSNPYSYSNTQPIFVTWTYSCGFLSTCTERQYVGSQTNGYDSNSVAGSILAGQLVPCASGHGECRVANGTFSFNYSGNYAYGYYNNYRNNFLDSGSVHINEVAAVPEPGTLGLMGTGLLGLAFVVKRKIAAGLISAA
jgi:hypothetical protein